ncbi:hypothetical protein [Mycobacterium spongiae]|uniref:Uncharacterized protein n=1 Tax=Mycobacterium spongiae TaxID=886343 RepID=A0A975PYC0_9MYCO|nr:hypothetical protein [Mycobacterium spongiae]QUR69161.1 hypothetical protein F6B93_20640 [Mycobacterium spongiae]
MSVVVDEADVRTRSRNENVDHYIKRYVSGSGHSAYDCAVIAGNGIGAQVFAAQLAKHPRFEGRVTMVAPPNNESRRLINGVSLRGLAADFIASALGTDHAGLLAQIAAPGPAPVAHRQTAAMAVPDGHHWRFTRTGAWQGGRRGRAEPIVYGIRNTRLVGGISELLANRAVTVINEKVASRAQLRSFALGRNPLLVNATTQPTLLGGESAPPRRMVLAVQVPLITTASGPSAPAQHDTAIAPLIRRDGTIDVGYYTPFSDPESPRSTWYGIIARVVNSDSGFDKQRELDTMTDELYGLAAAMGMTPDDPEETLGRCCVPAAPWEKTAPSQPGTLDLKRMYSGGAPCFYADGMVSAAIGGVLGAEAVARGDDPDRAIRRALRRWRRHNFLWWIETNHIATVADYLLRISVPIAMAYPHSAGIRMWRSAA